jgi:hypothetical protein
MYFTKNHAAKNTPSCRWEDHGEDNNGREHSGSAEVRSKQGKPPHLHVKPVEKNSPGLMARAEMGVTQCYIARESLLNDVPTTFERRADGPCFQ